MTLTGRVGMTLAVSALALVGVGAYFLGVHHTRQADWHTVTIDLASVAADEEGPRRLVSIGDDGWTHAIEDSVMWTDERDVLHDSGWPECLEPDTPASWTATTRWSGSASPR